MKNKTLTNTAPALTAALGATVTFALTAALSLSVLADELPTTDRAGNEISVPAEITKVISMAPSTSQVLEELGLTDLLVAVDTQTAYYMEETADLPQFDMMAPDCEAILALDPDIVFVTGMSYLGADDPYAELVEAGICVAQIPSSNSTIDIEDDILFISECFGMQKEGVAILNDMNDVMAEIALIGETITDKKTVLFEIACLPNIYSFGNGVFLNEMLELIGAENVFADQESWIAVTEESAIAANPDVILTSVNYIEDPVGEILGREGWENVTAVKNGSVAYIDNESSGLPNQNIVIALKEMAQAIYPEEYAEISE